MNKTSFLAGALLAAGILQAGPIPVSKCTLNNSADFTKGFTCELYPSDSSGNFSGDTTVNFPGPPPTASAYQVTPGYLVLDSNPANIVPDLNGSTSDPNQADWTQVLYFKPAVPNGAALSLELFTVGCNSGNPNDRSCFPSYATIFSQAFGGYDFEPAPPPGGVYNYPCTSSANCGANQGIVDYYNIHYILPGQVPEPSTMWISIGGLTLLGVLRRSKSSKLRA